MFYVAHRLYVGLKQSQSARVFINTNILCSLNKIVRFINDYTSEKL